MKSIFLYLSLLTSGEHRFTTGDCLAVRSIYSNADHPYALYRVISLETTDYCILRIIGEEYWLNPGTGQDEKIESLLPGTVHKHEMNCNAVFRSGKEQTAFLVQCPGAKD